MELESGVYTPKTAKTVTVWPRPDAKGDGPEVYVDRYDAANNHLGRDLEKDSNGETVHEYLPPEDFTFIPTKDPGSSGETGTYCRTDNRGRPLRDVNGNAVSIRPGTALVENPDGTSVLLADDFSHVLFARAHDRGDSAPADPAPASAPAALPSIPAFS